MKYRKTGFTLIEIIVVTGAVGLIMVALIGIVLSTFKSQNRTKAKNLVSQSGAWILSELKRDILTSGSWKIRCGSDNLSVGFTNIYNGEPTTFVCGSGKIASNSAHPATLNDINKVMVSCGSVFVSCDTLPSSDEVSAVNFSFVLTSNILGIGASQDFDLNVTVRN